MTERILVIGTSCSGKSTFARRLAAARSFECVELDAHFWGPNWTPQPTERFRAAVATAAAGDAWVIEGNYSGVRDVLWPRATAVIWLNYSLSTVLLRGVRRTVKRNLTREQLWHGNRESLRRSFFSRESILVWILTTHERRNREFSALRRGNAYPQLEWTELRHPREADAYLAGRAT